MESKKHDHKGTKKLKVLLFAIVMLLPIIAIASTCLYVTFNKNAKDSYTGDYTFLKEDTLTLSLDQETQEFPQAIKYNNYQYGNVKIKTPTTLNNYGTYAFNGTILDYSTNNKEIDLTEYKSWYITTNSPHKIIFLYKDYITKDNINNLQANKKLQIFDTTTSEQIEITYTPYYTNEIKQMVVTKMGSTFMNTGQIISYQYYTDTTISSVFYASSTRVFQAPIFNWVMNGPFYAAITSFTSIFGIPNMTLLTNLLTYWLTITCIYVVIDIILEIFIYLSHLLFTQKDM